jgi:hypothetical protein
MKQVFCLLLAFLLVVVFASDRVEAGDIWKEMQNDNRSHPWGGDEGGGESSGDALEVTPPSVRPIPITGIPAIDFVLTRFFLEPEYLEARPVAAISARSGVSYAERKAMRYRYNLER